MELLYTKYKIFNYKEKIDSLPLSNDKILAPVHVRIKPTNVCNHNCKYCAYRVDNLQLGKDMNIRDFIPKGKMMELIEDMEEMGVEAVTFSGGGEPFAYPYFGEIIQRLSETNIKFAALTNGSLLKGKIAEIFARHATWLRVSIDGWDEKSYAEYRGTSLKEFEKVKTNLRTFAAMKGNCYLGVNLIVDRKNCEHIYDLAFKLKRIGISSVKISPCIVSNDGEKNNNYHAPIFQIVKQQIKTALGQLADDRFEVFDSYHGQLNSFQKRYSWCPYLQILPVIGADCNIYSCHDKAYNLDTGLIGNIRDQRFKDVWFSDKRKFFKINPSLHCNHHCVVHEQNEMLHEYLHADRKHIMFV